MAKINVDTKKSESKDEMDKLFEELNAWAEKHKERGFILLTINENNFCGNAVVGWRDNLIKAMASGMLNVDSDIAYIIHEACGILEDEKDNENEDKDKTGWFEKWRRNDVKS